MALPSPPKVTHERIDVLLAQIRRIAAIPKNDANLHHVADFRDAVVTLLEWLDRFHEAFSDRQIEALLPRYFVEALPWERDLESWGDGAARPGDWASAEHLRNPAEVELKRRGYVTRNRSDQTLYPPAVVRAPRSSDNVVALCLLTALVTGIFAMVALLLGWALTWVIPPLLVFITTATLAWALQRET